VTVEITGPDRDPPAGLAAIDLYDPESFRSGALHGAWRMLREQAPVWFHERPGATGFWCVTRYADCERVLKDHRTFSSEHGTVLASVGVGDPAGGHTISLMDPPRHTLLRTEAMRSFSHAVVRARAPRIRAHVRELVGRCGPEPVDLAVLALPLPMVLAGEPITDWRFADASTSRFGGQEVPVRLTAQPRILPVLGANGIMADLDSVRRLAGDAQLGGTDQVWLSADAPPGIVDALEGQGLVVLGEQSTSGLAGRWAAQADVVSAPFELFTVLLAVLVAATMVAVVAIVEREPQAEQLRALRVQGLARTVAVTSAYAGVAALVAAGLVSGLLAALLARPIAAVTAPPFPDHWRLIPPPDPLGPGALGLAAAVAAVALAIVAVVAVRPLVHRLRGTVR